MGVLQFSFRFFSRSFDFLRRKVTGIISIFLLRANGVNYGGGLVSKGIPVIKMFPDCSFRIGENFRMNNGRFYNMIGRQQPCYFVLLTNASLRIGKNVGMSSTAIFCSLNITIGDHVKFGGNTCIYDTDFHSLNYLDRQDRALDAANAKSKAVSIGDNVFVGAHTTILKGVTIGDNSIIGACSVITKNIPPNEIWAGNPAKFVRTL